MIFMKKVLVLMLFVFTLVGCSSNEVEETEPSTLTCNYNTVISDNPEEMIFTFEDDEIITVTTNGEEDYNKDFWMTMVEEEYYGSTEAFLDDMYDWFTNETMFEEGTCVYERNE